MTTKSGPKTLVFQQPIHGSPLTALRSSGVRLRPEPWIRVGVTGSKLRRSAKIHGREQHQSGGQKPKADDSNSEDRFTVAMSYEPRTKAAHQSLLLSPLGIAPD
jgi:hypothetical protein